MKPRSLWRPLILVSIIAFAAALAGEIRAQEGSSRSRLVIAYPSLGGDTLTLSRYSALNSFISEQMGMTVEPVVTDGYTPIYIGMRLGKMDMAYMGPLSYIELSKRAKVEPLVMELSPQGKAGYKSMIITSSNSGIYGLSQARDRVFAMTNPDSTSGFLIPCFHLMREYGQTPAKFASEVVFTGSHDQLILGVKEGKYAVGATNDIDLDRVSAEKGFLKKDFVVLWESDTYPASPWVVRADLDRDLKKSLLSAMLAAGEEESVKNGLGVGGFIKVKGSDYDNVRSLKRIMR